MTGGNTQPICLAGSYMAFGQDGGVHALDVGEPAHRFVPGQLHEQWLPAPPASGWVGLIVPSPGRIFSSGDGGATRAPTWARKWERAWAWAQAPRFSLHFPEDL